MSLDIELRLLIEKGTKPEARYDIVRLIMAHKCVTVAILDDLVELTDKAIRNFLVKLQRLDFVEHLRHKLPDGKWITLIALKGSEFDIAAVVKAHFSTRTKKKLYRPQQVKFVEDVPFNFWIVGGEIHYENKHLMIHVVMDTGTVPNAEDRAIKKIRVQLLHLRQHHPQILQYLEKERT